MRLVAPILLGMSLHTGCVGSTSDRPPGDPDAARMSRFRVLTYNTLHGLDVGRLWVRPGESEDDRTARITLQIDDMARVEPDVMLLQEVNPLPRMATAYVDGLRARSLTYNEVHQVDACGVRPLPGVAVVPGLNNGLVVLAKAPLLVRKLAGLKLSGGFGLCRDRLGVQFGELRYALIAEVENPASHRKLLVVSLHLHSGIERDEYFTQRLLVAQSEGRIQDQASSQQILNALAEDQQQRVQELRTLLAELKRLQAAGSYVGILIGGDFNFEPDSPGYRELQEAGLRDTYTVARRTGELHTYDPRLNPVARQEEIELPPTLASVIQRMPEDQQQRIKDGYRRGVSQARRIDFLFMMLADPAHPLGCLRQELFGRPNAVTLGAGSDHFGVLDTYTTDGNC
ncbi:Endo/exonuclease/phosphatase domain-containing protein [Nitrospira tepida]|uniref:Endo/exonuclease/phosphatase domain-containing protein n=2 Tax=Nitrospira tepida TaxID=2973512 RepID=A0AA86T5P5_9BACT|nr:Endo/exonuclease/phosphatase domain-containing protein [Nitrospira tepida]